MMLETEAKTKWCPFAGNRVVRHPAKDRSEEISIFSTGTSVATGGPIATTNCAGSECMAWRTTEKSGGGGDGRGIQIIGYCGLAGKP